MHDCACKILHSCTHSSIIICCSSSYSSGGVELLVFSEYYQLLWIGTNFTLGQIMVNYLIFPFFFINFSFFPYHSFSPSLLPSLPLSLSLFLSLGLIKFKPTEWYHDCDPLVLLLISMIHNAEDLFLYL